MHIAVLGLLIIPKYFTLFWFQTQHERLSFGPSNLTTPPATYQYDIEGGWPAPTLDMS